MNAPYPELIVVPDTGSHAAALADLWNREAAAVPGFLPVNAAEFAAGARCRLAPCLPLNLAAEACLLSRHGGRLLGFAHVAVVDHEETGKRRGLICFLLYARGQRAAGELLLEAAERWLAEHDATDLRAFADHRGYAFYHQGQVGLSDRLLHVGALFLQADYRPQAEQVFMARDVLPLPAASLPDPAAAVRIGPAPAPEGHDGWVVRVEQQQRQLGACHNVPASQFNRAADAAATCYTQWLGVRGEAQGRGWGRYLLARSLEEMAARGCRRTLISTLPDNARALLFYSNLGYQLTDTLYSFARTLPYS